MVGAVMSLGCVQGGQGNSLTSGFRLGPLFTVCLAVCTAILITYPFLCKAFPVAELSMCESVTSRGVTVS